MRSHSNNTLHEILSKHDARDLIAYYFRARADALGCLAEVLLCAFFDEVDFEPVL